MLCLFDHTETVQDKLQSFGRAMIFAWNRKKSSLLFVCNFSILANLLHFLCQPFDNVRKKSVLSKAAFPHMQHEMWILSVLTRCSFGMPLRHTEVSLNIIYWYH